MNKRVNKVNTREALKLSEQFIKENIDKSNHVWNLLIQHTTTLSATVLVLSGTLLPKTEVTISLDIVCVWLLLFVAILLGILHLIEIGWAADKLSSKEHSTKFAYYKDQLLAGNEECEETQNDTKIVYTRVWIGAASIVVFLTATLELILFITSNSLKLPQWVYQGCWIIYALVMASAVFDFRESLSKSFKNKVSHV